MSKKSDSADRPRPPASVAEAELELMLRLGRLADFGGVFAELGRQLLEVEGVEGYLINLLDEAGEQLVCREVRLPTGFADMEAPLRGFRFPLDRLDINVEAYGTGQAALDMRQPDEAHRSTLSGRFARWRLAGALALALEDGDRLGTVTLLLSRPPQEIGLEPLRRRLRLFAHQIRRVARLESVSRREAELRHWAQDRRDFLAFINEINRLTEPAALRQVAADYFMRRHPFDLVGFLWRDGEHLPLRDVVIRHPLHRSIADDLLALHRDQPFWLGSADGATPLALLQQSDFFFPDVQRVLHLPMSDKDRRGLGIMGTPRTFLIMPLLHHGEGQGVLWLISLDRVFALDESERELLRALAGLLGPALANAESYALAERRKAEVEHLNRDLRDRVQVLDALATTDGLTGLYNYAAFERSLQEHVLAHDRQPERAGLSLLVIDVDHFKRFNDCHGHLAGNEVLKGVARRLRRVTRQMDLAFRYGGEEFVIILPSCDQGGARVLAERVRYEIGARPLSPLAEVSVSVGYGSHRCGEPAGEFFSRVDRALYRAKAEGRDRCCAAD